MDDIGARVDVSMQTLGKRLEVMKKRNEMTLMQNEILMLENELRQLEMQGDDLRSEERASERPRRHETPAGHSCRQTGNSDNT